MKKYYFLPICLIAILLIPDLLPASPPQKIIRYHLSPLNSEIADKIIAEGEFKNETASKEGKFIIKNKIKTKGSFSLENVSD